MFVVGLTGGIGSGKTAVSDRFADLGIDIVDADCISRLVVEPGRPALQAITEHFGTTVLQSDGTLDRAQLRTRIFNNREDKQWLEGLLHPLIAEELIQQLEAAQSQYVIFVSPLMVESGQEVLCDRLVVVDVPENIQITRTAARDNNDIEQVKRIMQSQATREQRLACASDVIENTKGFEQLDSDVARLHQQFLQLAKDKTHNEYQ